MTQKLQALNRATYHMERLIMDPRLSPRHKNQLTKAHREVKAVRDRLAHEGLMARNPTE